VPTPGDEEDKMTRRDSHAELQKWFLDVDELLAEQREHAISPSTVPSRRTDPATWTMTLGALRYDLLGLIDRLVSSPGRWIFILDAGHPGGRYVQLLVYEDGSIVVEASSNNFLENSDRLSTEQEKALFTMGWNEPHRPGKPNWWSVQPTINPDTSKLARLILATLESVYGLSGTDLVTGKLFDSPRRGDTPASSSYWLVMKSDVEGEENYTDETVYWTAEELEAKTRVLLRAIARDLLLEVPKRATKAQLLELILGEAEEYDGGEES
jgi:hypothetical protein